MTPYFCIYKSKCVLKYGVEPLTALNKAFHIRSWHWEEGKNERFAYSTAVVVARDTLDVFYFHLEDNG